MSSQGPNYANSGADDATTGTLAWTDPSRIVGPPDGSYATVTAGFVSEDTHYLVATDFGFSIPAGATINGIVAEWYRHATGTLTDKLAQIVQGGSVAGSDLSAAATWAGSDQWDSFGSSSELWGLSWTDTDINASGFGAAISGTVAGFGVLGFVDSCRITVYYTPASFDKPPRAQVISTPVHWSQILE